MPLQSTARFNRGDASGSFGNSDVYLDQIFLFQ